MAHQGFVSVELAGSGDREAVVDALAGEETWLRGGQSSDGVLRFAGPEGPHENLQSLIMSVEDHVDRALLVVHLDGGQGATVGWYYEHDGESLERVDRLRHDVRWEAAVHFDYFAVKHGMHGAV